MKINKINGWTVLGLLALTSGLFILLRTFFPVITQEINYKKNSGWPAESTKITPVDTDFGIVIPKINANSKIIKNVDPYNSVKYQLALSQGVAHAFGTSLPDQSGNIFLFSHSSSDFFNAKVYNSIFYLLSKLEKSDSVLIYYQGIEYEYAVSDKKIIGAGEINYLTDKSPDQTLTLMTCWPPGTSFNRLIIRAVKK